ncbi:MAG TPA: chromosome segregation protein SMC [Anaerolineae bacterium]|nr:chromosome segregation protein SMC [Anaerolineae bacterium]
MARYVWMPMYLKRLELQGYKTFATKTDFVFDAGVTAIVGPNGSGKSNIADALRWVMGEQKYRTLRARRSDDMIFAGGQGRSRVGMAEVSLTLDNSAGWLPIDYTEVTIQRRSYRSGENQYFLNGSRVRRRDVVELLAKGGVSSNTYTIIGQGAVDASLNMRPEERRFIFEEAAGIAIHQAKRDQALKKLEDTRNNMLRANDIIGEIAPRLQRLSKQAERAREYQQSANRLEELLEVWYGHRWHQAQQSLKAAQHSVSTIQDILSEEKQRLDQISRKIDEARRQRAELRGQLAGWHSESGQLHSRLETLQRELAVKEERQRLMSQRRHEIQQEISPLEASRDTRANRIRELESELRRLAEERAQRDREWQDCQAELESLEDERQRLEQAFTASQQATFELATDLVDLRNRRSQLGERRSDLDREREEREHAGDNLARELEELTEQTRALRSERADIVARLNALESDEQAKQNAVQAAADRESQLRARLETVRQDLSKWEVRNEVLTKARAELADYSPAVRTVLSHTTGASVVVATVAELIQVPADLERAIGAALGNLLQAVVIKTWEGAERALRLLTESHAGRATFVPLDSVNWPVPQKVPSAPGILGLAADLVSIQQGLEPVLGALLGRTLVVEDLDAARAMRAPHGDLHYVTLEGQVVSAAGVVTGGSDASSSLLLAHERERRELPQRIVAAQEQHRTLEAEIDGEQGRRRGLTDELAALREERNRVEKALKTKDEEISGLSIKHDRAAQELDWHRSAASRLQAEIDALQEKERAIAEAAEAAREKERAAAEAVSSFQVQLGALDTSPVREKLAGLKTAVAVLQRTMESQETALAGHLAGLEQLESQLREKQLRVEGLGTEAAELERTIASHAAQTEELAAQADGLSSQIAEGEQQLANLEKQQSDLERDEATARRTLQEHEVSHNNAVLQRQRSEDELRNLQERIEADLETIATSTDIPRQLPLDIDARLRSLPAATEVPRGLEAEITRLRRRLRQLGPVDLEAMEEYEQVAERHAFLVGQIEDLEQAARSLRTVVTELDQVMEDKFTATFERVAVEFEAFFARLFNGGRGQLVLTDPENPLQTGVEILAQPPGRRGSSVATLSGGERALTGVALTFAILKVCATPFCFLDEVDARLDEVNVERFGKSLRELSEDTQLIVITHNRATLETADSIYGITMSGDGASRVLSLRLDEAEKRVSRQAAG